MITINPKYLDARQARHAEYLSALAELNEARARFIQVEDALIQRVLALEPDWRECAASISEAARRTGIGARLIAYYIRNRDRLADTRGVDLRCEKRRNGKRFEWYLCVDDLVALNRAINS